jgi:hypothetical protein
MIMKKSSSLLLKLTYAPLGKWRVAFSEVRARGCRPRNPNISLAEWRVAFSEVRARGCRPRNPNISLIRLITGVVPQGGYT